MFFSNRNNSYCVLNSSMCRSPARCLTYIISHLHPLQGITTAITDGKMEAPWGYGIHQQRRPSQDPDSGKIPPQFHTSLPVGCCACICLQVCLMPSVPPEPACPSLGMLGQSHHPSPWELGLDLCPRYLRVLPAKCQASVFQPCFLTAKASGSGISLMVSPDGSSQGHVASLCWG